MKLFIIPSVIILVLLFPALVHAGPLVNPPTTGGQLFFDDFTSSQFPQQWIAGSLTELNNSTEQAGYLISTIQRTLTGNAGNSLRLFGNNTGRPVVTSTLPSQFAQVVFKLQPFNITNPLLVTYGQGSGVASTHAIVAQLEIGLSTGLGGGYGQVPPPGLYFELLEATAPLSTINAGFCHAPTKQAIYVSVNLTGVKSFASRCNAFSGGTNDGVLYNNGNALIDLNDMHTFTIRFNVNTTDTTKQYAAFQVDGNGFMYLWQTACNCLGTSVKTLYPFITLSYTVDTGGLVNPPFTISQSLASQIDYVLANDFTPTSLPTGQILSSNINPPTHNPGIYQQGGFSLTQYIQFQANEIGQGNIYAGGLFLTGIFILIITLGLAGVMWKTRMGFSVFGIIWNISTLAFIYLMFYTGVIPLLIPVLVTIGAAAILFGIFRSGPPSMGGEVQS